VIHQNHGLKFCRTDDKNSATEILRLKRTPLAKQVTYRTIMWELIIPPLEARRNVMHT